jgi:hypothetical protein
MLAGVPSRIQLELHGAELGRRLRTTTTTAPVFPPHHKVQFTSPLCSNQFKCRNMPVPGTSNTPANPLRRHCIVMLGRSPCEVSCSTRSTQSRFRLTTADAIAKCALRLIYINLHEFYSNLRISCPFNFSPDPHSLSSTFVHHVRRLRLHLAESRSARSLVYWKA